MKEKTAEKFIEIFKEKNLGKTIKVKTKGKSMEPLIPEKSIVEVKIVPIEKLKRGDIAMYFRKEKFFIHRVLNKKKGKVLIKGDNNPNFDPIVKEELVLGKAVKINGKKTDSLEFKLTKIPLAALSFGTGKITEIMEKKQKRGKK